MTKQTKSGETKINIENLQKIERGDGVHIDSDTKYDYAGNFEAHSEPLIDSGTGKVVSIRTFTFKMNPLKLKERPPDKQTLFNAHAKQITTILWGDGLRPLEEVNPRVIINKNIGIYQIFVPCEPKPGVMVVDEVKNLSAELAKNNKSKLVKRN